MLRLAFLAAVLSLCLARGTHAHGGHEIPDGEVVTGDPIVRPLVTHPTSMAWKFTYRKLWMTGLDIMDTYDSDDGHIWAHISHWDGTRGEDCSPAATGVGCCT